MRILIVEDDPAMREVLMKVLQRARHSVEGASNGLEAIAILSERAFDVLLSDVRMAPIDGLALASTAKALAPRMKVLLVTAYGHDTGAREARAAGADAYMSKPFRMNQLIATIASLTNRAKRRKRSKNSNGSQWERGKE